MLMLREVEAEVVEEVAEGHGLEVVTGGALTPVVTTSAGVHRRGGAASTRVSRLP